MCWVRCEDVGAEKSRNLFMPQSALDLALANLPTPGLPLDHQRMDRIIARLKPQLRKLGVDLRPHLKTAKSIDIVQRLLSTPGGPAMISKSKEAERFAAAGVRDI